MKIDVILPSRGQPIRLMAVIVAFDALALGQHEVTYRVVCDMDDALTIKAMTSLNGVGTIRIASHIGSGPLARRMNEAAIDGNADVVTGAADDTFPIAQHWDMVIAAGIEQGHHAFSWQEANDPSNQTMIVLSRTWLRAVNKMVPEYFPFWFGDTWIAEVYELAFNCGMPIIENLRWGGKRGKTKGMRDLAFWFDFFAKTRSERESEARAICYALGKKYEPMAHIIPAMLTRDEYQRGRVPQYEEWFGADQGEPTEQYLSMKHVAEQWSVPSGSQ